MKDILLVISITFTLLFSISFFIILKNFRSVSEDLKKTIIDNVVMQEYIDISKTKNEIAISDELVDKENFIKFLSDSRSWAFAYIEQVQEGLKKFDDEVGPHIKYFDQYGDVVAMKPNYETLEKISIAYKELQKLMPLDKND